MPTIRLPEEAEHGDMVKKIDALIRELSKAQGMTASTRARGLRPTLLTVNYHEFAHVMATLEATTVVSVYAKNSVFSTGLQLEPATA